MDLVEFFDPDNIDHIKALLELSNTGTWPKGFIPDHVTFKSTWLHQLYIKLGDRWVKHILEKGA